MKLELCHVDTCLPDYWSGHHRLHLSILAYRGMTMKEIKSQLLNELGQDAFCGSDDLAESLRCGDVKVYKACKAAINRMRPAKKGQRKFFMDLEETTEDDDCGDHVCAFFVFCEI